MQSADPEVEESLATPIRYAQPKNARRLTKPRRLFMRKPNYRFERAERDRVKTAKREEKLQRQQERAAERAADTTAQSDPPD
jgi:hypothetical protein